MSAGSHLAPTDGRPGIFGIRYGMIARLYSFLGRSLRALRAVFPQMMANGLPTR